MTSSRAINSSFISILYYFVYLYPLLLIVLFSQSIEASESWLEIIFLRVSRSQLCNDIAKLPLVQLG